MKGSANLQHRLGYEATQSVVMKNLLICVIALCTYPLFVGCSTTATAGNDDKSSETIDCSNIKSIFCSPAFHTDEWDLSAWEQLREEAREYDTRPLATAYRCGSNVAERMTTNGTTPLMLISTYCTNPMAVQLLIDAGADVNARNDNGDTALFLMFAGGEVGDATPKIVRFLLKSGAEIETSHWWGWTPLTRAIMRLRRDEHPGPIIESLKALIEAGADVNAPGWLEFSPLMLVVTDELALIEVAKLLIDAGADVNARRDSYTVLMYAVVSTWKRWPSSPGEPFWTQDTSIVELLIDAGAEVNAQAKDGWTPLMVAARWRTPEFVQVLIDAGADLNLRNMDSKTALVLAKEGGQTQSVELLREAGAEK